MGVPKSVELAFGRQELRECCICWVPGIVGTVGRGGVGPAVTTLGFRSGSDTTCVAFRGVGRAWGRHLTSPQCLISSYNENSVAASV